MGRRDGCCGARIEDLWDMGIGATGIEAGMVVKDCKGIITVVPVSVSFGNITGC